MQKKIWFNNIDISDRLGNNFVEIDIVDRLGTELDICNIQLAADNLQIPDTESMCEIQLGSPDLTTVFKGVIHTIRYETPPPIISIAASGIAVASLIELRSSHNRSWNDATLGEIIGQVISDAGFTPRISKSLETIAVSKLIQTQSDIEFLENLANRYNAYLKSDSEVVAFVAKNERKTVTGKDLPRYEISERAEQIAGYQWITRKRQNYKSIEAYYVSNETYNKVSHGQGSPIFLLKETFADAASAQSAIESKFNEITRGPTVRLQLPGNPDYVAGAGLTLKDFDRSQLNGDFMIQEVRHNIKNGWQTWITAA